MDRPHYPCRVDCYRLRARNGLPPHPEDKPVQSVVVESKEDSDRVRSELQKAYPGSWVVEVPLD